MTRRGESSAQVDRSFHRCGAQAVLAAALAAAGGLAAMSAGTGPAVKEVDIRRFNFVFTAVSAIPADAEVLRLWVPLPQSDDGQEITNLRLETTPPLPHRFAQENEFGNTIAFIESDAGAGADLPDQIEVRLSFDVERREISENREAPVSDADADRLLEGDRLAPITNEVRRRTEEAIAGKETVTEQARAIYDRVLADMQYDKSGQGWGQGDIQHACDVGKGNCSDFHALFITMARAAGIPAYFEIGYPLPLDKAEGEIGGYHCWGWFQDEAGVWRPVDASEADKDPSKTDYYFGTLCCNRVALTKGRDLVIDPAPASAGDSINFLVYPIIEIDGKAAPAKSVTRRITFRDLDEDE